MNELNTALGHIEDVVAESDNMRFVIDEIGVEVMRLQQRGIKIPRRVRHLLSVAQSMSDHSDVLDRADEFVEKMRTMGVKS